MIRSQQVPVQDARRIRAWLNRPECREFQQHLASIAAEHATDAVNLLAKTDAGEADKDDAAEHLAKARKYRDANLIIDAAKDTGYKWFLVTLEPQPQAQELNENRDSEIKTFGAGTATLNAA